MLTKISHHSFYITIFQLLFRNKLAVFGTVPFRMIYKEEFDCPLLKSSSYLF